MHFLFSGISQLFPFNFTLMQALVYKLQMFTVTDYELFHSFILHKFIILLGFFCTKSEQNLRFCGVI